MNRTTIFLLLLVSIAIADNAGDKAGFLAKVNQIRREHAKKYSIMDMHELVWSQDLVNIAEKLDWKKKSWPEAGVKWRYGQLTYYASGPTEIENELKGFNKKSDDDKTKFFKSSSLVALELLVPTQTVIGCGRVTNAGGTVVCFLGPEVTNLRFDTPSSATPNCSEHYTYKDGLCSPEDPDKVSYFGFRDDFLPELNEIRRQYALDYQIPNMHELVWSEKLVKIGASKSWEDETWYDARITWRWVRLESYRNMSREVTEARNNWSKMDEAGRNKWMKMNSGSYLGLELLEPKQTSIGCVPKWEGADVFLLCLIGNQGDHDSPGSHCMKGYRNVNGLCTSTLEKRRARSI